MRRKLLVSTSAALLATTSITTPVLAAEQDYSPDVSVVAQGGFLENLFGGRGLADTAVEEDNNSDSDTEDDSTRDLTEQEDGSFVNEDGEVVNTTEVVTEELPEADTGELPDDWDETPSEDMGSFYFIDASDYSGGKILNYDQYFSEDAQDDNDVNQDEPAPTPAPEGTEETEDAPEPEDVDTTPEPEEEAPEEHPEDNPDTTDTPGDHHDDTPEPSEPEDNTDNTNDTPPEAPHVPDVDVADLNPEEEARKLSDGALDVVKTMIDHDGDVNNDALVMATAVVMVDDQGRENLDQLSDANEKFKAWVDDNMDAVNNAITTDADDFINNLHVILYDDGLDPALAEKVVVSFTNLKRIVEAN